MGTIGGMLSLGLAEGIGIGCATSIALELKNGGSLDAARMKFVEFKRGNEDIEESSDLPKSVWKLSGPVNFVSMFQIDDMIEYIKERDTPPEVPIVLDMEEITTLEFTGVEELVNRLVEAADGTPIQMLNCADSLLSALDQCD